jgi:hypothetical protein
VPKLSPERRRSMICRLRSLTIAHHQFSSKSRCRSAFATPCTTYLISHSHGLLVLKSCRSAKSPLNSRLSKDRRRSPGFGGTIENRPPGGGASSSWSQIVDGIHSQRLKWFAPDATVESIVISANSAPLAKARRRYCGISTALPRDQISVKGSSPLFACHQRIDRCGCAVISDTEVGPTSAGSSDPAPTRRAAIRNHATSSPGPTFLGADSAGASLDAIGDVRCLSVEGGGRHGRLHQFVCGRLRRNLEWTD